MGAEGGTDDRELMERLARGDRDALAPLVERHNRRLYRIALGYLRQREDALDVVQEAFRRPRAGTARPTPGRGSRA
jgi:DNA-directed RNA polymerase specialized sigma24 family protein